jgi:hypothetical protein
MGTSTSVLQQTIGTTAYKTIAEIKTHAGGTFSYNVPAGPSRTIDVAYRAFSTNTTYAAQTTVTEFVGAGVRLQITQRHTAPRARSCSQATSADPYPPKA